MTAPRGAARPDGNAQRGEGGRRYGFVKPRLTRLFTVVDAIGGFVARPRHGLEPRSPHRILLVNLAHFGDVLLTTPAVAAIRAAYPDAHVAMLVGPWSASVVAHNPRLNEVLVHPVSWWDRARGNSYLSSNEYRALIKMLRGGRFDAVVNFKSFFQENLAVALARIPERVGYGLYGGGFLHTTRVPFPWGAHTVEQHLSLAAALGAQPASASGATASDSVPEIFPSEEDVRIVERWLEGARHPLLALHLGAGTLAKMWPAERYAQLAQLVESRLGAHIVLVGGPGEEPLVERFRRHAPAPARDAVGRFNVPQLAVLLRRCRAFVGNDSGPAHLAAAVGIPTVTVFSGANRLDEWRPRGPAVATVQERPECSPCGLAVCARDDHACMTRITPERVFELLQGLIEGRCASAS